MQNQQLKFNGFAVMLNTNQVCITFLLDVIIGYLTKTEKSITDGCVENTLVYSVAFILATNFIYLYFSCENVKMILLLCAVSIYVLHEIWGVGFRLKSVMLNGFGRIKLSITKTSYITL